MQLSRQVLCMLMTLCRNNVNKTHLNNFQEYVKFEKSYRVNTRLYSFRIIIYPALVMKHYDYAKAIRRNVALSDQNIIGNALCMVSRGEYISFFIILEPMKTHQQQPKHTTNNTSLHNVYDWQVTTANNGGNYDRITGLYTTFLLPKEQDTSDQDTSESDPQKSFIVSKKPDHCDVFK